MTDQTEAGWVAYTGARPKQMHSIRLKSGKVHDHCYPNGNSWYIYGENAGSSVPDEEVAEIKNLGYCVGEYMARRMS